MLREYDIILKPVGDGFESDGWSDLVNVAYASTVPSPHPSTSNSFCSGEGESSSAKRAFDLLLTNTKKLIYEYWHGGLSTGGDKGRVRIEFYDAANEYLNQYVSSYYNPMVDGFDEETGASSEYKWKYRSLEANIPLGATKGIIIMEGLRIDGPNLDFYFDAPYLKGVQEVYSIDPVVHPSLCDINSTYLALGNQDGFTPWAAGQWIGALWGHDLEVDEDGVLVLNPTTLTGGREYLRVLSQFDTYTWEFASTDKIFTHFRINVNLTRGVGFFIEGLSKVMVSASGGIINVSKQGGEFFYGTVSFDTSLPVDLFVEITFFPEQDSSKCNVRFVVTAIQGNLIDTLVSPLILLTACYSRSIGFFNHMDNPPMHIYYFYAVGREFAQNCKEPIPLAILEHPHDIVAGTGDGATFTIEAAGHPLVYQWYQDEQPIDGATSNTLSIVVDALNKDSKFNCQIYNTLGDELYSDMAETIQRIESTIPFALCTSPLPVNAYKREYAEVMRNNVQIASELPVEELTIEVNDQQLITTGRALMEEVSLVPEAGLVASEYTTRISGNVPEDGELSFSGLHIEAVKRHSYSAFVAGSNKS